MKIKLPGDEGKESFSPANKSSKWSKVCSSFCLSVSDLTVMQLRESVVEEFGWELIDAIVDGELFAVDGILLQLHVLELRTVAPGTGTVWVMESVHKGFKFAFKITLSMGGDCTHPSECWACL